MSFPVGASVRIASSDQFHGRTGEVAELPGFPWRDCRRVKLDTLPGATKRERLALVYLSDLRKIEPSARPPPPGQLSLFREAA